MKKFLLLLPLLTLSITACNLFGKKDNGSDSQEQSQSEEVIDTKTYGAGNQENEILTVGYDIPAGEYWIKPSGVDNYSRFDVYDARGYNPNNEYENYVFGFMCCADEHYLTVLKAGQFLKLNYCVAQNSKVDQGITTIKNGMFKVGEQIKPVEGMVRVKVCEKAPERIALRPNFVVYTYNEKMGDFEYDSLDSKTHGVFDSDDTQYHLIENPPVGSYIELVGLEVC